MSGLISNDKKSSGLISLDAQYNNDVDRVDTITIFRGLPGNQVGYSSTSWSTVIRIYGTINEMFEYQYGPLLSSQEISKYVIYISGSADNSALGGLKFTSYDASSDYTSELSWGQWWSGTYYTRVSKHEITGSTNFPSSRTIRIRKNSGSGQNLFTV